MKIWFIVFLMSQGPNDAYREYYKVDTQFVSEAECVEYVKNPYTNAVLKDHIKSVYPITPVEGVWCIRQDVWKKMMSLDNGI